METKNAVYPLSADPMHYGHVYNLSFAVNSGLFDKIHVALGVNAAKKYLFSTQEKVYLAKKTLKASGLNLEKVVVEPFEGLLRNYAAKKGIKFIVRGARNAKDFEYEAELADYNQKYGLTTFIIPASEKNGVSSSMTKAIALEAGMTHEYVHPVVKQALEEKLRGVSLVGVSGLMGSGKTTVSKNLVQYCNERGKQAYHLDFDKLVHSLYTGEDQVSLDLMEEIKQNFGENVFNENKLNRKKLSALIFEDSAKREKLANLLMKPAVMRLEEQIREMRGLVFVDAAYFTEYNMLPLVNNNLILVNCDEEERIARIEKRDGLTKEQIKARSNAQHTYAKKKEITLEAMKNSDSGFFYELNNSKEVDYSDLFNKLNENFPLFK